MANGVWTMAGAQWTFTPIENHHVAGYDMVYVADARLGVDQAEVLVQEQ
jgi:hypothetical protein